MSPLHSVKMSNLTWCDNCNKNVPLWRRIIEPHPVPSCHFIPQRRSLRAEQSLTRHLWQVWETYKKPAKAKPPSPTAMEIQVTAPAGVSRKAARSMKIVWLRYATHVNIFLTCDTERSREAAVTTQPKEHNFWHSEHAAEWSEGLKFKSRPVETLFWQHGSPSFF